MKDLNYLEFDFIGKKLYIIKHHSTALLCWKKAIDVGIISEDSTLVHIDQHTDFYFQDKNKEKSKKILEMDDSELIRFIQEDLHPDNSEFIVNAMLGGIIKDGICIFHDNLRTDYGTEKKRQNSDTTDKNYFSDDGIEHNYYLDSEQDLSNIVGYQLLIGDRFHHQDANSLFNDSEDVILDIDLDYFTYSNKGVFSKNPKDIQKQLSSSSFKKLLDKSKIITIALEPRYCGGINDTSQCINILQEFHDEIFLPNGLDILDDIKVKFLSQ